MGAEIIRVLGSRFEHFLAGAELISAAAPELYQRTFNIGALCLAYGEGPPNGPPIVLLHGVGRNWQDFLPLIPELSQAWHVFAVDLRGHGASGRVPGGYTSSDYGSDIQALLARVIGRPAVLFGHSLGGIVGMRLAADEQNRISALIVGDSVLSREALQHSLYTALFTGLHRVALHGGGIEQMATELARIQIPVPHLDHPVALGDFPGNDDAYFRRWADCLRQVDAQVFEMTLDGSSLADFEAPALLSKIQCPTLILQASPDLGGLMSDKDVENAARLLRRCTVERFPLLGHALHLQRPRPVLDAILRFLQPLQKRSLRTLRT